jgi:hypothetical protein
MDCVRRARYDYCTYEYHIPRYLISNLMMLVTVVDIFFYVCVCTLNLHSFLFLVSSSRMSILSIIMQS